MKRVIGFVLGLCSIEMVLAIPDNITINKGSVAGTVQVKSKDFLYNVKEGGNIDFGDSESGTIGSWNGSVFTLSSSDKLNKSITVTSVGVPLVFDSFLSSQCKVYAPLVGIFGDTQVDNFMVKNLVESEGNNETLLAIEGELATKFLSVYGTTIIGEGGTVNLQENGALSLFGYGCNDYLGIFGTLTSKGRLNVETTENPFAEVINFGNIRSDVKEIYIRTGRFINNETGMILGKKASFQVNTLIENYGLIDFDEFDVMLPDGLTSVAELGLNTLRFIQHGTFMVQEQATLSCNLESLDRTYIHHLVFPYVSELKMAGGETLIDRISGRTSFVGAKEGAIAKIGNMEDGADHVESHGSGSELTIARLISDRKVVFAPKSGGEIIIGSAQAPESFLYTEDGELNLGKLDGKSTALIKGTAKLKMNGATDFTLVAEDEAETQVDQSVVKTAYLLGNEKNTFTGTTVESLNNHGKLRAVDTNIKSVENDNEISFAGNTLTDKLYNSGVATFENGKHNVGNYVGRSLEAAIKVQSKKQIADEVRTLTGLSNEEESAVVNSEKQDQVSNEVKKLLDFEKNVILQTGSSLATIDNITGTGDIEAFRQIHNKKLPTMFHTVGNVAAVLDYMPRPNELPEHDGGDFLILANMHEDYINSTDISYDDVLIFMQMNGHKWENRYAKFIAGGLKVNNASSWGNTEGFIGLERLLSVDAGVIYNTSNPIARDNGRWVDDWSNWRARLVYYCPATYYSPKSNRGIAVIDGDINLKSQTNILNQFSNIYAGGNFNAKAGNVFDNKVGNILASGKGQSSIEAQNIKNECLPLYIRKGEAHAKGRCGWGFGRHTWYADSYTAELVTQSPGSTMLFRGDLETRGNVENIGSKLLSQGLFSGYVNSRSMLENIAMHGSRGTAIEEDFLNYEAPLLFMHVDSEKS